MWDNWLPTTVDSPGTTPDPPWARPSRPSRPRIRLRSSGNGTPPLVVAESQDGSFVATGAITFSNGSGIVAGTTELDFEEQMPTHFSQMGNDIVGKQQNFDNEHKVEKDIAILVKPAVVYFGPPSASKPENFTSDKFVRSASSDGADSAGDIGLLVAQFGCSPDDAALALNANEKDLVDAMFALASKGSRLQTKRDEG